MLEIGKYHELKILRLTSVGMYLEDESGEEVLLPNKYCPQKFEIGDKIRVFVYRDHEERKIATNIIPKIQLHEFALLKVTDVSNVGAFLDWGLEKELMVPFKEQRQKMEEGRWYIVYLDLDKKTDRLYASNRIEKFISNEHLRVHEGEEVELLVYRQSDIGYAVLVNNLHKGLIYADETFTNLNVGDRLKGYVKKIRQDHKLDISLQALGYRNFNDKNSELIYNRLVGQKGFLAMTDKSSPEQIYAAFGMSKKAFKKAIGALYKKRVIKIESKGIRLIDGT